MQLPAPLGQNPSLPAPNPVGLGNKISLVSLFNNNTRWQIRCAGIAEDGVPPNDGSGLVADAFDDNGNNLGNAFIVERQIPGNWYFGRKIVPSQDTGAMQAAGFFGIYAGTGVPNNANGINGDYYFRGDTPGTANQRIYVKSAGAWVGIV